MKFKTTLTTLSAIIALAMMPIFTFSQNKDSTVDAPDATTGFSTFSVPQNLGAPVNSVDTELLPVAAPSGLSLYFTSNRATSVSMVLDIWVSQRATVSSAWGVPQLVSAVNTSSVESITSISPDGREMFIQSNRPGGMGGSGNDIYISTRSDPNDDFGWTTPVNLGAVINTTFDDSLASYFVNPATGIGTLYFSSDRTPTLGSRDVYQSTRNADGTFNAPTPVSELNSSGDDSRLAIRRDGLELFFSSTRPGPPTGFVIYTSTRASVSSPWSAPVAVAALNTGGASQPALSPDDSILYFVSSRPGGIGPTGTGDLYSAATRNFCVPTTTVTEGNLFPGGIVSFGVSSGQNSVTIDHVNAGTGLQSLTVVGVPVNATVNIPAFAPGTTAPVVVTFTPTTPGLAVDFTLRAASTFHAANIRVRCAETCTPTTTVTEGDLAPGGIVSFGITSGAGSVTIDHVNAGTGLQSLTVVGVPTNAVVFIPAFTPGTFDPLVVTFSVPDPTQPVDFTLRAASTFHAVNIRVRCATPPNQPEK